MRREAGRLTAVPRRAPPRASRGFTLLEAIVAVAIVGIALVPIITFISQMVMALNRAGDANARNLAEQSVVALLDSLNPLEHPNGDEQVGNLGVHWESEVLVPPNTAMKPGAGLAGFAIGFYTVKVSVNRADQRGPWFAFDMRKVGYQRIAVNVPGAAKP